MTVKSKRTRTTTPEDLQPSVAVAKQARTWPYWIGLIGTTPIHHVHIAGLAFPKCIEPLMKANTMASRKGPPVPGEVVELSLARLERIERKLKRKVFRPTPNHLVELRNEFDQIVMTQPTDDTDPVPLMVPGLKSIILPPDDMAAKDPERYKYGKRMPGDVLQSEIVYCVPMPSGERPRDGVIPPPLSETGLVWPELETADA